MAEDQLLIENLALPSTLVVDMQTTVTLTNTSNSMQTAKEKCSYHSGHKKKTNLTYSE